MQQESLFRPKMKNGKAEKYIPEKKPGKLLIVKI